MASVFLEQWHLFFPKVSAVWRHFLIFLHARVSSSRLSFYPLSVVFTARFSFTSLSFPVSSGSSLSHYLSISLSLAHSPPFKLGSFQISDFHRCARLQSVIFVTDSFIIHCTSKTLECNTWPEFEQESVGYLVSFSYWMQNIEVMLLYSWATREFHMNKLCMYPVCTVVFLHWRFDAHWKACV